MIDNPTIDDSKFTVSGLCSNHDRDWFIRVARGIGGGSLMFGALRGVATLLRFARTPDLGVLAFCEAFVGACSEILLYGVLGLAAAALVRALGVWTQSRVVDDRSRSPDSRVPIPPSAPTDASPSAGAVVQLAEIRRLIRDQDWDAATDAVRAFREADSADPRGVEASDELERTMQEALGRLEAQLQAAREVNDPDQVLEIHGRMSRLLKEETRKHLDVDLSHWFLTVVHRRLRSGRIQADVVELADRIAESFGHTTDGASLRASMPTLRRSAGLCPRCAKPYTGTAQACPECLKPAPTPPPSLEPDELDEPRVEAREPNLFVEPFDESTE